MTAPLPRLATLLDGDLRGHTIFVGDHVIDCKPTGQVVIATLPDAAPLGSLHDPDACAAAFRAEVGAA